MKRKLTCALLFALTGCGGGGGGSDDEFAGVWNGNLSLVEDSCNAIDPSNPFVFFTHLVNQDGTSIVLDNGLLTFSGTVESDRSFQVQTQRAHNPLYEGASCTETIVWRYEDVRRNSANFVVRRSTVSCTGAGRSAQCEFALSGSAYRSSGGGQGPIILEGDNGTMIDGSSAAAETSL